MLAHHAHADVVYARAAVVERHETLPLGHYRAAQRVLLTLPPPRQQRPGRDAAAAAGQRIWLVNTHLHHGGATPAEQVLAAACIDAHRVFHCT